PRHVHRAGRRGDAVARRSVRPEDHADGGAFHVDRPGAGDLPRLPQFSRVRPVLGGAQVVGRDRAPHPNTHPPTPPPPHLPRPPTLPASGAAPGGQAPRTRLVRRLIAYAHALRHQLRGSDAGPDLAPWLAPEEAAGFARARLGPSYLLRRCEADLGDWLREG